MAKKILAMLSVLIVLVGVVAATALQAGAADQTYQVGYSRVDITPYIDPTLTGDALVATSNIMQLPLRGSGDVWNRLSTKGLLDDNGDGVIDGEDGLKATSLAVTDAKGKTVLMITVDLIGGTMINKVNVAVMERVNAAIEAGELENVDLAKERIYYGGTHTHSAPDTTVYVAAGKTGTNNAGVDLSVVNENLGIWINRTIDNICDAAIESLKDRAPATLTKDQLAVSDATSTAVKGKTLTMTRHYVNGEDGSVAGDNFNDRGDNPTQVTDCDDNIYLMKFSFADSSKLPIILTSFRGHPSLNNSDSYAGASRNMISSDYINAYRKALEYGVDVTVESELGVGYVTGWTYGTTQKYRVLYFNGTGGNTNPRGYEILRDANGNPLTYGTSNTVIRASTWIDLSASKGGNTRANSVGTVLAVLAQECLADGKNQTAVPYGEIKSMQKTFTAKRKTVGITSLSHNAGVAYQASDALYDAAYSAYTTANSKFSAYKTAKQTYDDASSWLKWLYQSDMDDALAAYNEANATLNEKLAAYEEYMAANFTNTATQASTTLVGSTYGPTKPLQTHPMIYKEGDETFAVASRFHASNLVSSWNTNLDIPKTGDIDVTLNVFTLGEKLAFVVVPGEPFDYYFKEYGVYTPENNLWNILNDDTYGKPVVLGYTNGAMGYFPNYEAYFYNEGRTDKAIGSYESQNNAREAGTGERMIYEFDFMLSAVTAQSREAYCEHCEETVFWEPYAAQKTIYAGHYYLTGDYSGAQIRIADNEQVCLDLNGYTITGDVSRALYLETNTTTVLSIMDSSEDQTGLIRASGGNIGAPNGFGGSTIFAGKKSTVNLYSGTLADYDNGMHSVYAGGVMFVRGTFNMYGGKILGGTVSSFTGQYLKSNVPTDVEKTASGGAIETSGTLNLFGGQIVSGDAQLITGTVIGSEELGYAYSQTVEPIEIKDPCITVLAGGIVNLGGDCKVDKLYFADGLSANLTVEGSYTGSVELTYPEGVTLDMGTDVGDAKANVDGARADVSLAAITFTGYEDCYAAVKDTDLIVSESPWTYRYCDGCKEYAQWKPMAEKDWDDTNCTKGMEPGHYVLTENITSTVQKQLNVNGDLPGTFCVDLAGYTYTGATRAFYVYDKAVLNILDTVGGGILEGKSGTATGGGVLYSQDSAVINLYGGTVRHNNENNDYISSGGCVRCNGGSFNMYGGKLEALNVTTYGCAIYVSARTVSGTFYGNCTLMGGEITAAVAQKAGNSIYVANKCKVTVGGTAKVADVYFDGAPASYFTVDATTVPFAGTVQVTCKTRPAVGATVGSYAGTKGMSDAVMWIGGSDMSVVAQDTKLVTQLEAVSLVKNGTGYAGYPTLAQALEAYTYDSEQNNYIRLNEDATGAVTVSETAYVDLNGYYISGALTVEDGAAVYAMDSQTDDYTVEDEYNYGKIVSITCKGTGKVEGVPEESAVAGDGYLMVKESDGTSFHRVNLQITGMSLRASAVGVYYTCDFAGDEVVAENVKKFGIALSAMMEPDADVMEFVCEYSAFLTFKPCANGNSAYTTGTLLRNIMKPDLSGEENRERGEIPVYGRAYIETEDGYMFGACVTRSLEDQLEDIDKTWSTLTATQQANVLDFYEIYGEATLAWEIPNIRAAAGE